MIVTLTFIRILGPYSITPDFGVGTVIFKAPRKLEVVELKREVVGRNSRVVER